ncbi:hypothetical protein MW695_02100 [Alkalihalobacillus sp. APA_J-10(15)]|nr:hypothetical protein [Halalkalibacter sp. APA_J-10(15)]
MVMKQTFTHVELQLPAIVAISKREKITFFTIKDQLKAFTKHGEISLLPNTTDTILPHFHDSKKLIGICYDIQRNNPSSTQNVYLLITAKDDEALVAKVDEYVKQQEREEQEKQRRFEAQLQKQQEDRRQQQAQRKATRARIAEIKAKNRTYMQTQKVPPPTQKNSSLLGSMVDFLFSKPQSAQRVTHCFDCKQGLDSQFDYKCQTCNWLVCSCGACGCTYQLTIN